MLRFGKRHESDFFQFISMPIRGGGTQFCLSVPKRVGSAPKRNRVKRLLREWLRKNKNLWPSDNAIMIKVKPRAGELDSSAVGIALNEYLGNE